MSKMVNPCSQFKSYLETISAGENKSLPEPYRKFSMKSTIFLSESSRIESESVVRLRNSARLRNVSSPIDRKVTSAKGSMKNERSNSVEDFEVKSSGFVGIATKDVIMKIEVYSQLFADIIEHDNTYGSLLLNVKSNYDSYISHLRKEVEVLQENSDNMRLETQLRQYASEICSLKDTNKKSLEVIQKLERNIETMKFKETKYCKLISVLKQQGYPIKEIYYKYIKLNPKMKFNEKETLTHRILHMRHKSSELLKHLTTATLFAAEPGESGTINSN